MEGILCLSVSLSSSRSPLCLERRRHTSFSSFKEMHIGESDSEAIIGSWPEGSRYREKKKKRGQSCRVGKMMVTVDLWLQRGDNRGPSAILSQWFPSSQQNWKCKCSHYWTSQAPCGWAKMNIFSIILNYWGNIYREVGNRINISPSHLTVNFQIRYS